MKLQIEKEVYGGSGLAHTAEGRAVFVPFALPGEMVEAEVADSRDGTLRSTLPRIVEPSSDRVTPRCRHFGACGGCQYQNASGDAQLRFKQSILLESMERAGLDRPPTVSVHAAAPWHYRNRIRLRVGTSGGTLVLGYNRRASVDLLPISECPIAAPLLWRAAEELLALTAADAASARCLQSAAAVELACTNDEGRLQLTLLLRQAARITGFDQLCLKLQQRLPELVGAGASHLSSRGSYFTSEVAHWAAAGLPMRAAGHTYWVARDGFFQVNRFLVDELVRLVTKGRRGVLAWDLFAGVGLFTRVLLPAFTEVVAVEASTTAVANLARLRLPGVRTVCTPVLNFLEQAALERERPELIVLDPPRAGLGLPGAHLLGRVGAPAIVYVSCDPVTLSRDLRAMVDSGYNLAELHLVDLFPQTFHLETVAVLERARD